MGNSLPTNAAKAIDLGVGMSAGLVLYATELEITQPTSPEVDASVAALSLSDGQYNNARSAEQTASGVAQVAMTAVADWLSKVRGALTSSFGPRWNTQWAQAGFILRARWCRPGAAHS